MSSFWPMFFLLVVLKVPVIGMIYLLWWATNDRNLTDGVLDEGEDGPGRRKPQPRFPIGPRRGPHGGGSRRQPVPVHRLPSLLSILALFLS